MNSNTTDEQRRAEQRAYHRAYYLANKEKSQAKQQVRRANAADKAAVAAYNSAYYAANKEEVAETARAWRKKNAEKVKADRRAYKAANREKINAQEAARYHANKEARKEEWRERWTRNNKLRPAKVLAAREAALGRKKPEVCEVCGGNDGGISFDHCHAGGYARGWLCDLCNCALGFARDDPERLRKLAVYLENSRAAKRAPLTGWAKVT